MSELKSQMLAFYFVSSVKFAKFAVDKIKYDTRTENKKLQIIPR